MKPSQTHLLSSIKRCHVWKVFLISGWNKNEEVNSRRCIMNLRIHLLYPQAHIRTQTYVDMYLLVWNMCFYQEQRQPEWGWKKLHFLFCVFYKYLLKMCKKLTQCIYLCVRVCLCVCVLACICGEHMHVHLCAIMLTYYSIRARCWDTLFLITELKHFFWASFSCCCCCCCCFSVKLCINIF